MSGLGEAEGRVWNYRMGEWGIIEHILAMQWLFSPKNNEFFP